MIGVARQAIAQVFAIDLGTARLGVFVFLKDHDTGTFAHDKTVTIGVIGARGLGGIIAIFGRQRLAGVEARDADFADRGLGPAGDHDIRIAPLDQTRRIPDGMSPGGTGGDHGVVRPLEAIANRHLTRDQVDQRAGNEEGRHATRALLGHHQRGLFDGLQPADARAQHDAGAQLAFLVLRFPAGILHGHLGRGNPIEDEVIDLATLLRLHPVIGIEGTLGAIPIGDCPSRMRLQVSSTPLASGVTSPSPVTTTRRIRPCPFVFPSDALTPLAGKGARGTIPRPATPCAQTLG